LRLELVGVFPLELILAADPEHPVRIAPAAATRVLHGRSL
jgi:hypothetical protein